jgi:hypothetical protein
MLNRHFLYVIDTSQKHMFAQLDIFSWFTCDERYFRDGRKKTDMIGNVKVYFFIPRFLIERLAFLGFIFLLICGPNILFAQTGIDSLKKRPPECRLTAFADIFHVYDLNRPPTKYRQTFLYNHNRHAHPDLNLALLKVSFVQSAWRANLAFHGGTYVTDNYAAEPGYLRPVAEANAGIVLGAARRMWLDVGIFQSYIGFESAISTDNMTLTRSLLAENSPYYMAGGRLSYTAGPKLEMAFHLLNGWQRIRPVAGNSLPSFGTQVTFRPSDRLTLNWSTFLGTDDPDATRRMRYFSNFYLQSVLTDRWSLTAGFDVGVQQQSKGVNTYDQWYSPVLMARYALSDRWKFACRGEYYHDPAGVIVKDVQPSGFKTGSISFNADHSPTKDLVVRLEARWMFSRDKIFPTDGAGKDRNFILAGSVAYRLTRLLSRERAD